MDNKGSAADIAYNKYLHSEWNAVHTFNFIKRQAEEEKNHFVLLLEKGDLFSRFGMELADEVHTDEEMWLHKL